MRKKGRFLNSTLGRYTGRRMDTLSRYIGRKMSEGKTPGFILPLIGAGAGLAVAHFTGGGAGRYVGFGAAGAALGLLPSFTTKKTTQPQEEPEQEDEEGEKIPFTKEAEAYKKKHGTVIGMPRGTALTKAAEEHRQKHGTIIGMKRG